jgi:hypothetical protein
MNNAEKNKLEIYQQPNLVREKEVRDFKIKLESFEKMIDSKPHKTHVLTHKDGFNYIPIDVVEAQLNKYYFGLHNWTIDSVQIVVNEILVYGTLEVFHPIAGIWLKRSGIGACQIRMTKGAQITDINSKLKTALQMDAPHAEKEAIKNAAAKFGRVFGRGLRRDMTMDYTGFNLKPIDDYELNPEQKKKYEEMKVLISEHTNGKELSDTYKLIVEELETLDFPVECIDEIKSLIQTKYDEVTK